MHCWRSFIRYARRIRFVPTCSDNEEITSKRWGFKQRPLYDRCPIYGSRKARLSQEHSNSGTCCWGRHSLELRQR
jgi:hypothetical protein